jgi:hypothetical protein
MLGDSRVTIMSHTEFHQDLPRDAARTLQSRRDVCSNLDR